jgi:hypothetical protein
MPAFAKPKSALGFREIVSIENSNDEELRMKALLNAAMDSRDDLFPNPIPRAASTPPTRLLSRAPKDDLSLGLQDLDLNEVMTFHVDGWSNSCEPNVWTSYSHWSSLSSVFGISRIGSTSCCSRDYL